MNYIAFSGGGESMSAILGGQVSVGINGLAEFAPQIEAGTVRVLGISSAERLPGVDAPTLREQGVDVEFENWRSLVAPPGISRRRPRAARDGRRRDGAVGRNGARCSQRYRWIDRYLAGDEFARFSEAEETRVRAILTKLGTGTGRNAPRRRAGVYPLLVLAGLRSSSGGGAGRGSSLRIARRRRARSAASRQAGARPR